MACKFRGFASATNTGLCALTPRPATPRNFCRLQVAVPPLTKRQTRPIGSSPIAAAANMSSMAGVGPYDPENIFSKILDGKVPSYKVFETEHSLAFLDAFPMVPGHSLLIPKVKGYATMDEMPAEEAGKFLADLPRLVQAVQAATGCEGVNVCQVRLLTASACIPCCAVPHTAEQYFTKQGPRGRSKCPRHGPVASESVFGLHCSPEQRPGRRTGRVPPSFSRDPAVLRDRQPRGAPSQVWPQLQADDHARGGQGAAGKDAGLKQGSTQRDSSILNTRSALRAP